MDREMFFLLFIWALRYFTTIQCLLPGEQAKASGGGCVSRRQYMSVSVLLK